MKKYWVRLWAGPLVAFLKFWYGLGKGGAARDEMKETIDLYQKKFSR